MRSPAVLTPTALWEANCLVLMYTHTLFPYFIFYFLLQRHCILFQFLDEYITNQYSFGQFDCAPCLKADSPARSQVEGTEHHAVLRQNKRIPGKRGLENNR